MAPPMVDFYLQMEYTPQNSGPTIKDKSTRAITTHGVVSTNLEFKNP